MSHWERLGVSSRELKKARAEAGHFLGESPQKWDDMGVDEQQAKVEGYIEHLCGTKNKIIADKLVEAKDTVNELLRIRTKTIRAKQG